MKTMREIKGIADKDTTGIRKQVYEAVTNAYYKGFKRGQGIGFADGRKVGESIAKEDNRTDTASYQEVYQKGIEDTWKVFLWVEDNDPRIVMDVLDVDSTTQVANRYYMDPQEAIDKIAEYERKKGRLSKEKKQSCNTCIHNDKEWDSEQCDGCTLSDSHYVLASDIPDAEKMVFPNSPCDLCRFSPPGSGDGKPCTMCPAESSNS